MSDSLTILSSGDLKQAIENMAIAINSAPPDKPNITMKPRLWLMWEAVLDRAGIPADIGQDI